MPDSNQYQAVVTSNLQATIAASASLSDAVDLSGTTLTGYILPSVWNTADITLQASADGTSFLDLYDQFGNEMSHSVVADRYVIVNPADFASIRFIKIRSGTSATPVTQTAQRLITLVTRSV